MAANEASAEDNHTLAIELYTSALDMTPAGDRVTRSRLVAGVMSALLVRNAYVGARFAKHAHADAATR